MKKILIKSVLLLLIIGTANSCLDYEDLRDNPNNPNSVPPSLLFTDLMPGATASFTDSYMKMQYHAWVSIYEAYSISFRSGFGSAFNYGSIRNIDKLIEEADASNAPVYKIFAKFLKARTYIEMTRRMGDIPFTEADKGIDNPRPKYDSSKSVYIQSLNWLDEASLELKEFIENNPTAIIDGDFYYDGNLKKWQKLINSYTLRILISLSKKANDADVDVKGRFNTIVSNPSKYPIFESNADNAELDYRNEDGFKQTYIPDAASYKPSVVYTSTYIDKLKKYSDPRLFVVADPTPEAVAANPNLVEVKENFDSYVGVNPTLDPLTNTTDNANGEFSRPNEDKYWNYVGQPGVTISYWEQEFTIAEAAHRGWISNNAKDHYDNAVRASMEWYGVASGDISDYLSESASEYISGALGLTRILEQKYLAFAENSDTEPYFNFRRTGVPELPYSTFNVPATEPGYPVRWTYSGSERSNNEINYKAALVRQFGAETDDIDDLIWELKIKNILL